MKWADTRGTIRIFQRTGLGGDTISPYDSLFQVHADSLSWDWRLLAAVAFKESRFDTTALSYAGAGGLMQMMPTTALRMGVTAEGGLNGHVRGGRAIWTGWTASG
ncbi:MAG: transglycosylase SLT domain-containing protein [Flavobacteriales bacterium]|nr:transglycosylase SLT domain-containing protein [Flavobacteriales bacterium]